MTQKDFGWEKRKDVRSVAFTSPRDIVTVMWTETEDQQVQVKLPSKARIEDMFGRPIKSASTITVTQDPVFVITPR